jgi:hypothetical protein
MSFFKKLFSSDVQTDNKELQHFVGEWKSRYGSYLKITSKGKGDCEKIIWEGNKTTTKTIRNGNVNFDNGKLLLEMTESMESFYVTRAPYVENGTTVMVLDNVAYSKIA